MAKWTLELNNLALGGFAPRWFDETYPSYGNKNMAGAMENMDLTTPGFITQGPGLTNLANGNESGAVATLIKWIVNQQSTIAYAVGGNQVYKIVTTSSTAGTVTDDATWPYTIDKAAVTGEDALSCVVFQGALYYLYSHSGSAGDIGKYDLASTFDDDWGSTTPTGAAALQSTSYRPAALGGNDTFAFGNGRYVGTYDGTTLRPQALDFPSNYTVVDVKWLSDKWWITTIYLESSSVFIWDGVSDSWEAEIKLPGQSRGGYVKNNVFYTFYNDPSGYNSLSYIDGNRLVELATFPINGFTYGLPEAYQITNYKDFIVWVSGQYVFAYGAGDKNLEPRLFQLAKARSDSDFFVGAMQMPTHNSGATIGKAPIVASGNVGGTTFRIARLLSYDTDCSWSSLMFDITGEERASKINTIRFNFEKLAANARVDWSLVNNQGQTIYSDIISHTKLGAVTSAWYNLNGKVAENFRVQLTYSNGNTTNPVKLKNIKIYGER